MRTNKAADSIIYVAVVDDDESVCRSFGRLLRIAGFQPVTYSSAEAFLADTKRPQFDCLVLDVQLEGISGLELRQGFADVLFLPAPHVGAEPDRGFGATRILSSWLKQRPCERLHY